MVLSYLQAEKLFKAKKENISKIEISPDLGLTNTEVLIEEDCVVFKDKNKLSWKDLKKILKHRNRCYLVEKGKIEPIVIFSDKTGWVRTLYPTDSAPTTLVSGILMHRIKDTDPAEDTKKKVQALGFLRGATVLDTATGLGYTAIEMANYAKNVVTVEWDPAALELAKLNPYSNKLFNNPKITQIVGDISEEIKNFEIGQFTHILHDPPTFKIAGQLYSGEMYKDFYRVLKKGGRLFHYIGDPESESGFAVTKSVMKRLEEAGFTQIEKHSEAFGVTATKP